LSLRNLTGDWLRVEERFAGVNGSGANASALQSYASLTQFASPVCWIETQGLHFKDFAFERFIEIGPSPTLTGMATRTLKAKYKAPDDSITHPCVILCHVKNGREIYY
jgi:hypothetical protein